MTVVVQFRNVQNGSERGDPGVSEGCFQMGVGVFLSKGEGLIPFVVELTLDGGDKC